MPELAIRDLHPEIMDDPALDAHLHIQALRGLSRIHRLTGTLGRLWAPIRKLIQETDAQQLTVLDVGCGDGVFLRQLWKRANRLGCRLQLVGCDFSSRALALCDQAQGDSGIPIELHQLDVTQQPLPRSADVIINSLFLHHFTDEQVARILAECAEKAEQKVIVQDLIRSRWGYLLCWIGIHLVSRSRVVHTDGLLSVRAAFTMTEMRTILDSIGMHTATLTHQWPERYLIEWPPESKVRTYAHH